MGLAVLIFREGFALYAFLSHVSLYTNKTILFKNAAVDSDCRVMPMWWLTLSQQTQAPPPSKGRCQCQWVKRAWARHFVSTLWLLWTPINLILKGSIANLVVFEKKKSKQATVQNRWSTKLYINIIVHFNSYICHYSTFTLSTHA